LLVIALVELEDLLLLELALIFGSIIFMEGIYPFALVKNSCNGIKDAKVIVSL